MSPLARRLSRDSAEQVMASAGKTFHQASRLLPAQVRAPIVQLYGFCRAVDDLADEKVLPLAERKALLTQVEHDLWFAGSEALQLGWSHDLADHSRMMTPAAVELVRAALGDLTQKQPAEQADLVRYAFGVAGTVGLMLCDLLGADHAGQHAAIHLGTAMQLTNIARDVAEDLHAERIYLPATWVDAKDVRLAMLGIPAAQSQVRAATAKLLVLADQYYESAYTGIVYLPRRVQWSILSAALCYRQIGVEVRRDIDASWRRRTTVTLLRKLWLIAKAACLLLTPRFRRLPSHAEKIKTETLMHPLADVMSRMEIAA